MNTLRKMIKMNKYSRGVKPVQKQAQQLENLYEVAELEHQANQTIVEVDKDTTLELLYKELVSIDEKLILISKLKYKEKELKARYKVLLRCVSDLTELEEKQDKTVAKPTTNNDHISDHEQLELPLEE